MKTSKLIHQLKTVRKASGLSQRELAEISGVAVGTVAQYESRGGTKPYVFDILIQVCQKQIRYNQRYARAK